MSTADERKILLVEDDEIQAVFVQAVLAKEYDVTTVRTLEEALERLTYEKFSAVLLDLGLPDSVGPDTLASINTACVTTPVVVLTASDDDRELDLFRIGAQDFIRKKDFNLQLLRRSLRYAMERKRLEERLVHGQKLEAVGELSAGVAHEFNNLLQAIRGYAKIALDSIGDGSPAYEDLKKVVVASDDAAKLTKQLLSFGRRVALRRERTDVSQLLCEQMEMIAPLIEETISISTDIGTEPVELEVDATELRQVVMNLCINARDAMPEGGELSISSRRLQLAEPLAVRSGRAGPGDYFEIVIRDNGCGMSREVMNRIFEPFFTTKEVGKGTGMGMSMVYGVVRQHNGNIDVQSEVGVGTTFRILLPVAASETEQAEQEESSTAVSGDGQTILVVEDNPGVRELCERVLTHAGYQTLVARDGVEGVQLYEKHRDAIELIFLDVVMPRMTGRDVYELVSSMDPEMPFIFCTGYATDGEHTRFIREIEDSVLIEKPFPREKLLEEVNRHVAPSVAAV